MRRKPDMREYEEAVAPFDDVVRQLLRAKPQHAKKPAKKRPKKSKR